MTIQIEKKEYSIYIDAGEANAGEIISLLEKEASEIMNILSEGGRLFIAYEGLSDVGEEVADFILKRLLKGTVLCKVENVNKRYWDYDRIYIVEVEKNETRWIYMVYESYVTNPGVGSVDVSFLSSAYTTPR